MKRIVSQVINWTSLYQIWKTWILFWLQFEGMNILQFYGTVIDTARGSAACRVLTPVFLCYFFYLLLLTRPLCTMGTNKLKETNLWFKYARSLFEGLLNSAVFLTLGFQKVRIELRCIWLNQMFLIICSCHLSLYFVLTILRVWVTRKQNYVQIFDHVNCHVRDILFIKAFEEDI